jgi:hypothetical protein
MNWLSKLFSRLLARVGYDAGGDVTAADLELHDIRRGIPRFAAEKPRSPEWPRVRRAHLEKEPVCQWCGGSTELQVHHIQPFHLAPALELDPENLITLCEKKGTDDHLEHGHLGDFKNFNPQIRQQCEIRQQALKHGSKT